MTTWHNTRPPQSTGGKLIVILNGDVYKIGEMINGHLFPPKSTYAYPNPHCNFWAYLDRDCYFNPRRTDKPDIKIDDSWNKNFDLAPKGVIIEIMVLQGKVNKIHVADAELDDARGILQPNKVPFGIGSNSLFYAWRKKDDTWNRNLMEMNGIFDVLARSIDSGEEIIVENLRFSHNDFTYYKNDDGTKYPFYGEYVIRAWRPHKGKEDLIDIRIWDPVYKSSRIVTGAKFSYGEYRIRKELVHFHPGEYAEAWRPHKPVSLNDIWLKARKEKKNEQEIKDILKEDLKKHIKLNMNSPFCTWLDNDRVGVDFCAENGLGYSYSFHGSGMGYHFKIQPKQEIK